MPCDSVPRTAAVVARQQSALERLNKALGENTASLVIGPEGSIAFRGRTDEDRRDVTDLCAFRRLAAANSPTLRRAVARAEAMSGRKINQRALAIGVHSHDGGSTWGTH